MKCYRILYQPDDTAFMVWAETEEKALELARTRNITELENADDEGPEDYLIDEFTPESNGTGILAFYDVQACFERND